MLTRANKLDDKTLQRNLQLWTILSSHYCTTIPPIYFPTNAFFAQPQEPSLMTCIYARNFLVVEVVLVFEAAIWKKATPPKGPAGLGLAILTAQTLDCPPTEPEQAVPAGTAMAMGYCKLVMIL